MVSYIVRRVVYMVFVLVAISMVAFVIIQLPPGDYVTNMIDNMRLRGERVTDELIELLAKRYGLDMPLHQQYLRWAWRILQGDFGRSMEYQRPVSQLIGDRLTLTVIISMTTLVFTYVMAIPIGIYSATRQYSVGDYLWTFFGFVGLATPNFLLAMLLMLFFSSTFGMDVGGLFSVEYELSGWSVAKVWDLIKHLPIPIVVLGTAGTAGLIRVLRASLLDELAKNYVVTAQAKGLPESRLIFKYPVRIALNPIISQVSNLLPAIVSGSTITSIVLNLPTVGPLLFGALQAQDMHLAAALVLMVSTLGVIGTLISDILLAIVDPRIRLEK